MTRNDFNNKGISEDSAFTHWKVVEVLAESLVQEEAGIENESMEIRFKCNIIWQLKTWMKELFQLWLQFLFLFHSLYTNWTTIYAKWAVAIENGVVVPL